VNIHSDFFRDSTEFIAVQRVTIWSTETDIKLHSHNLNESVSKRVAVLLGIKPAHTCKTKMQAQIQATLNAQSPAQHPIALFPRNAKGGKKKTVLRAIHSGAHDVPQVTALLKNTKLPLLQLHFLDSGGHRGLPALIVKHKSLLATTKMMTIENLRPDHAQELRWLFHAGSKWPGKIGNDVVDISDAREQGVCFVKYVHCSNPQTQILKDVITLELRQFGLELQTHMPVGSSWLPPTLKSEDEPASARPAHTADSDGEDSGRFSHMSLTIKTYKEEVAKMAAAAAPTPVVPVPVTVATVPRQQEESWSQQKHKQNKATRQSMHNTSNSQFLLQGLYAQTQGPGNPMECPACITHNAPPDHGVTYRESKGTPCHGCCTNCRVFVLMKVC